MIDTAIPARSGARAVTLRSAIATAILAPWLLLIMSRQVALFAGNGGGPPGAELLPWPLTGALVVTAVVVRLARPSVVVHALCVSVVVCGIALLAASLGTPFANATSNYCGDFCRNAIMSRFAAFFVWPIVTGIGLVLVWLADRRVSTPIAAGRADWSLAWVFPTVPLGLLASVAWSRIVLP